MNTEMKESNTPNVSETEKDRIDNMDTKMNDHIITNENKPLRQI